MKIVTWNHLFVNIIAGKGVSLKQFHKKSHRDALISDINDGTLSLFILMIFRACTLTNRQLNGYGSFKICNNMLNHLSVS